MRYFFHTMKTPDESKYTCDIPGRTDFEGSECKGYTASNFVSRLFLFSRQ